jgi:membrane protease YdiL (CAAX protease family)
MTAIKAFIKSHPLLSFYALAFAISWGGILLMVGGPGGILGTKEEIDRLLLFVMMAWFAGPSVASIVLTGLLYGREGFRDLFARMTRWRVGARWYALALLLAPILFTAVSLALSLISPEFLPGILTTTDKAGFLLFGISYGLIGGGFLEELGWTGFAVPRMRLRYGIVGTGLIVGLLWGAYHFSVMLWMSTAYSGALPLAILLPVQMFAWLPAYRVLMVWVYDRTGGSLLVAMLMHASLAASMLILQPLAIAGVSLLTYILVFGAAMWVVGAVAVANHRHLTRRPPLRGRVA